jgi:hypothetical protein
MFNHRRSAFLTPAMLSCVALIGLAACEGIERAAREHTAARINAVIARYHAEAPNVKLGDPKEKVLALLEPTQAGLLYNEIKPPEAFHGETDSGERHLIEIFFYRSARYTDELPDSQGFPPDDDFTPYIFTDGVLTGTGWPALASLHIKQPKPLPSATDPACDRFGPVMGCF